MGRNLFAATLFPAVLAVYLPFCTPAVRPTLDPWAAPLSSLWVRPADLANRDLFNGPWGAEAAPDPGETYTLVERKHSGINPGMTVRDGSGRKWSVKQGPLDGDAGEGPVEVVLSRVLSAAGYRQPPVYYLSSFTVRDDWGRRVERGGRFRLHEKSLKDRGDWSWQQNPFVGMRPYQGLLVILLMFNSSDLKNSNNTLYEHRNGDLVENWYVVRDLGTALGESGRIAPARGNPDAFERFRFVLDVRDGFVRFDYRGFHQELVRERITPDDVGWASDLLSRLTDRQWRDAFRAGGYPDAVADRFIRKLESNIALGRQIGGDDWRPAPERP
jgi:hypothetical protein